MEYASLASMYPLSTTWTSPGLVEVLMYDVLDGIAVITYGPQQSTIWPDTRENFSSSHHMK